MRVIKIDVKKRKVYYVDIDDKDPDKDIRNLLESGGKEKAHQFQNKDILYIDSDGVWNTDEKFGFGSKQYGYKTFHGHGVVVQESPEGKLSDPETALKKIKGLVIFGSIE